MDQYLVAQQVPLTHLAFTIIGLSLRIKDCWERLNPPYRVGQDHLHQQAEQPGEEMVDGVESKWCMVIGTRET